LYFHSVSVKGRVINGYWFWVVFSGRIDDC
jgi:hypothetical protein